MNMMYPTHMSKIRRMMEEHIKEIDVVIELLDARIPASSKNPDIDTLIAQKPRIMVLTNADKADESTTTQWVDYFRQKNIFSLGMDLTQPGKKAGLPKVLDSIIKIMPKPLSKPIRIMVVGIPNVGKSSLINMIAGRNVVAVGETPGTTRGRQWIAVRPANGAPYSAFNGFDLMDTPGLLWPTLGYTDAGLQLAIIGAMSDASLDKVALTEHLLIMLGDITQTAIHNRYSVAIDTKNPRQILTDFGESQRYKIKNGDTDLIYTANLLLDEFRRGTIGRISLESPSD